MLEDGVVEFNLVDVTTSSSFVEDGGCVDVMYDDDSVIGFLLSVEVDDGWLLIGRRVTKVDLTVEVFIVDISDGLEELNVVLSVAEIIEKVVVNAESSFVIGVEDSTRIIELVGFGRGVFVV